MQVSFLVVWTEVVEDLSLCSQQHCHRSSGVLEAEAEVFVQVAVVCMPLCRLWEPSLHGPLVSRLSNLMTRLATVRQYLTDMSVPLTSFSSFSRISSFVIANFCSPPSKSYKTFTRFFFGCGGSFAAGGVGEGVERIGSRSCTLLIPFMSALGCGETLRCGSGL